MGFKEQRIEPEPSTVYRLRSAVAGNVVGGYSRPSQDEGALRFSRLHMRPMSLFESGHSTGGVSLAALFEGDDPHAVDPGLTITDLADRIAVAL